jgi:uncharacterized RDD family membrane protein YckC
VREHVLETPESLELHLRLAGPGPRMAALLIDAVLQGLALVITTLILFGGFAGSERFGNITLAFSFVVFFLIQWGYYSLFEVVSRGRSPGKRIVGVRVVRSDGQPLDPATIVIRNFLRVVDSFPFFYLLGGLVATIDRRQRRIGDMAAGTLVVHELSIPRKPPVARIESKRPRVAAVAFSGARLTERELYSIRRFLTGYEKLPEDRQVVLATKFASRVAGRVQSQSHIDDPIAFLEGVYSAHAAKDGE